MNLFQRLWNMIGFGTVTTVNDGGPVRLLQIKIGYLEVQNARPQVEQYGHAGCPPIGADCVTIFQGGDRSKGLVIGVNHQGSRPTAQVPGESTQYNDFGMTIYLSENGIVVNGGGQNMTIENTPTLTHNGDLHITGAVIGGFGGGDQVGLKTHKHKQSADSHGDTEADTDAPTAGT